jgi:hypothetical protein
VSADVLRQTCWFRKSLPWIKLDLYLTYSSRLWSLTTFSDFATRFFPPSERFR